MTYFVDYLTSSSCLSFFYYSIFVLSIYSRYHEKKIRWRRWWHEFIQSLYLYVEWMTHKKKFRKLLSNTVPPVIEPFAFQSDLSDGMRTRLICGVSRGDLPLRLTWLKDGEFLTPSLGANVSSIDQFTSILSIPSLSHTHSGEYTCVASNQASEVKYSATLQVKGNVDEWGAKNLSPTAENKINTMPPFRYFTWYQVVRLLTKTVVLWIAFDAANPSLIYSSKKYQKTSCKFSYIFLIFTQQCHDIICQNQC